MLILINPPNPPGKISNKDMMAGLGQLYERKGPLVPPIDIAYIAACLRDKGVPVKIIDCLGSGYDQTHLFAEVEKTAARNGCPVIALRTSLPSYPYDLKTAQAIKAHFGARIILFGPYVTLNPMEVISHDFIDAIVLGEPEYVFVDMCLKGMKITEGMWFKDRSGDIVRNPARDPISQLDKLPFPAWDLMPYMNYTLPGDQFPRSGPFLPVLSSRGCPFACHYCPYPTIQGNKWRARSAENIVGEIEYLTKDLGITNILFRDPEFALDRNRVIKICGKMEQQKVRCHWRCETRVDTLDKELILRMSNAGCRGVNFGVETINQRTALKVGRKISGATEIVSIVECCKDNEISVFCFFIIGLPSQDKSEIVALIDLAKELDTEEIQFTFATPYPGTRLFEWAEKNRFIEDRDMSHYTGYRPVMRNDMLSLKGLKRLHLFAQHTLHMRKRLKERRVKKYGLHYRVIEAIKEMFVWLERSLITVIVK